MTWLIRAATMLCWGLALLAWIGSIYLLIALLANLPLALNTLSRIWGWSGLGPPFDRLVRRRTIFAGNRALLHGAISAAPTLAVQVHPRAATSSGRSRERLAFLEWRHPGATGGANGLWLAVERVDHGTLPPVAGKRIILRRSALLTSVRVQELVAVPREPVHGIARDVVRFRRGPRYHFQIPSLDREVHVVAHESGIRRGTLQWVQPAISILRLVVPQDPTHQVLVPSHRSIP